MSVINQLDKIFEKSETPAQFAKEYAFYLADILKNLDFDALENVMQILNSARLASKQIFFIGNGGSAATASHFANDLGIGVPFSQKPFKVLSLTDNVAIITAVGNDFGYEKIFTKQLQNLLTTGDVVVAISASGNSPNLLNAVEYANSLGSHTIGLVGFDGGKLKTLCKSVVHVQTAKGEYGPVEDIHMIFDHLIGSYFNRVAQKEV